MSPSSQTSTKKVFLSSTSRDLQPEREAIRNALERMKDTASVAMELFGSRNDAPKDVCLAEVGRADVYVGVFGARYGYVDPESNLSMTELEYRAAIARGLPCLIYLKEPETAGEFQETDANSRAKLESLKAELQAKHVVSRFKDADNLATRVVIDLHNLMLEHRLPALQQKQRAATPRELHIIITTRLSMDELRTIAFYLGVHWDYLGGETLPAKARSLIEFLSSRERLGELEPELREVRPDIRW